MRRRSSRRRPKRFIAEHDDSRHACVHYRLFGHTGLLRLAVADSSAAPDSAWTLSFSGAACDWAIRRWPVRSSPGGRLRSAGTA
jgi:hypothetical protein